MEIISWPYVGFALITLIVYYVLPRRAQNYWLLIASYVFYCFWSWQFALVLLGVTTVNYLLGRYLRSTKYPRRVLWLGIALNILTLAIFKYADFFVPQAITLLQKVAPSFVGDSIKILLPVGLSFVILQTISYLVDIYRGQLSQASDPIDFALYLAYFPKLLSGPIESPRVFLPQLAESRVVNNETLRRSTALISLGLVRKVLIANILNVMVPSNLFTNPQFQDQGGPGLLVWLFAYGIYLYNDFAGYTSIVRGVSLLFGIELTSNFRTPYLSRNFTEFWNQWHISLTIWLRSYIYFPLARALLRRDPNPGSAVNQIAPPVVTMLVSGLWHAATWNLLVWGLVHGLYQVGERAFARWFPSPPPNKRPIWRQVMSYSVVFFLAMLAWIPFQATLPECLDFLQGLTQPGNGWAAVSIQSLVLIAFSMGLDWLQQRHNDELFVLRWSPTSQAIAMAITIVLVSLATAMNQATFIYQGF